MLNPFRAYRDWTVSRAIARDLWGALQRVRGPGRGINIPQNARTTPETAHAVTLLLGAHPELTAEVWGDALFVCFKDDLAPLQKRSDADFSTFHQTVQVTEGEDVTVRTEVLREQEPPKEVVPKPRWPGALSGRDPRDVPAAEWAEWEAAVGAEVAQKEKEAAGMVADGVAPPTQSAVNVHVTITPEEPE